MNLPLLISILSAGFAVAFFHAAIPTHWLPFVVASRAQGWTRAKTLGIAALAGGGHIAITTLLGLLLVWLGMTLDRVTGNIFPWIAGGLLIAIGLFYLWRQARGQHLHFFPGAHGHHHHDAHCDDDHHDHHGASDYQIDETGDALLPAAAADTAARAQPHVADRTAIFSLIVLLTLSPCESFLPFYVSALRYGWLGFAISSLVLALATLAGMLVFISLTLAGLERVDLRSLERYEGAILGIILCALGVALILVEVKFQ
jgi:ABC-type nickel/cobalt efflux system permease component RcnA